MPVASKTLDNSYFTQSFEEIAFLFATPVALNANTVYFVNLTSNAVDTANGQYFIKGDDSTLNLLTEKICPLPRISWSRSRDSAILRPSSTSPSP